MSARGGRRRGATAAAEAGIALAMLFLMFVSALVGFGIGRHTGGNSDNVAAVASTRNGEETVTTSGGAGGEGATSSEATTSEERETTESEATTATSGGGSGGASAGEGKAIFTSAGCSGCHTLKAAGSNGNIGPNLDEAKPSFDKAVERVTHGKGPMPSFKGQLTDAQIHAVAKFVSSSTRG